MKKTGMFKKFFGGIASTISKLLQMFFSASFPKRAT